MGFAIAQPILRGPIKREYVTRRNRLNFALPGAQHQPARIVDRLETPGRLAVGKSHPDRLPKPQGARKPRSPDPGKACTAVP